MLTATLYNALTLPQTADEFMEKPLMFCFLYDSTKPQLFQRFRLVGVKFLGQGEGSIPATRSPRNMFQDKFPEHWSNVETWMRREMGPTCMGIGAYLLSISIVGTNRFRHIPKFFPVTEFVHRAVVQIHEWEERIVNQMDCFALYRSVPVPFDGESEK